MCQWIAVSNWDSSTRNVRITDCHSPTCRYSSTSRITSRPGGFQSAFGGSSIAVTRMPTGSGSTASTSRVTTLPRAVMISPSTTTSINIATGEDHAPPGNSATTRDGSTPTDGSLTASTTRGETTGSSSSIKP
ncbi:hypothetical protein ACHAPU_006155 [Fusarium lateritium]